MPIFVCCSHRFDGEAVVETFVYGNGCAAQDPECVQRKLSCACQDCLTARGLSAITLPEGRTGKLMFEGEVLCTFRTYSQIVDAEVAAKLPLRIWRGVGVRAEPSRRSGGPHTKP